MRLRSQTIESLSRMFLLFHAAAMLFYYVVQ
jgi:hypothetical protein